MNYRSAAKKYLLSADIILEFLNGEDISEIVVDFYSGYIIKISELTITDSEEEIEVKYLDRDLMQLLNLSVVECLPNLRENIKRHIDPFDDFEIKIKAELVKQTNIHLVILIKSSGNKIKKCRS